MQQIVDGVIEFLATQGITKVEEVETAKEHLVFALPPELRRDIKNADRGAQL